MGGGGEICRGVGVVEEGVLGFWGGEGTRSIVARGQKIKAGTRERSR